MRIDCADAGKLADAIKNAACSAYGTAGPEFVRRIMAAGIEQLPHWPERDRASSLQSSSRVDHPSRSHGHAKKFALIGIAGELATHMGVTPWEGDAFKAALLAFERRLETRGGAGSQEERQAIEQVRSHNRAAWRLAV